MSLNFAYSHKTFLEAEITHPQSIGLAKPFHKTILKRKKKKVSIILQAHEKNHTIVIIVKTLILFGQFKIKANVSIPTQVSC